MPSGSYSWLPLTTAIAQVGQRLNITPSASSFWTTAEIIVYINQALRMYNVLTNTWKADFVYNSSNIWNSLGTLAGSPRLRTLTDTYCYTQMQNMLLEPASGGTWSGTSQFSIDDMSQALQTRRDEMLQVAAANQVLLTGIPSTPGVTRTLLPDTTIDVARIRYMPVMASPTGTASSGSTTLNVSSTVGIVKGQIVSNPNINYWTTVVAIGSGSVSLSIPTTGVVTGQVNFIQPTTLYRDDTVALEFYEAPLYQQPEGTPNTFSLSSDPPLSFTVDIPPNQPATYEAVVMQTGTAFAPPAATLLGIPDDFSQFLIWGALADLLGREAEATDSQRAAYCLARYQAGLQLMLNTPWAMLGKVTGQAVNLDSIYSADRYNVGWDSTPQSFGPVIIIGGIDFVAAPILQGTGVTVLANSPFLDPTNTYVQVSRSNWDTVLDLIQFLCAWKQGGEEFERALELEKRAIQAASAENSRLRSIGAFADVLDQRGQAEDRDQARYNSASEQRKQRRSDRISEFIGSVGDRD